MALDTRDKRASATAAGLLALMAPPLPDGAALSSGDRLHVGALYRGIAVSPPPAGGVILQPAFHIGPAG